MTTNCCQKPKADPFGSALNQNVYFVQNGHSLENLCTNWSFPDFGGNKRLLSNRLFDDLVQHRLDLFHGAFRHHAIANGGAVFARFLHHEDAIRAKL